VATLQEKFGKVVRDRRTKAGVGQEAFADKAGLHRTHLSLIERGKRNPTLEVIKKLASALETTMASLMEELEAEGDGATPAPAPQAENPPAAAQSKRPRRRDSG
jgi:transcriptional regulator with XRE-family HTH domain